MSETKEICPYCLSEQVYVGFREIECPTRGCYNFSIRQELDVYRKNSENIIYDDFSLVDI